MQAVAKISDIQIWLESIAHKLNYCAKITGSFKSYRQAKVERNLYKPLCTCYEEKT